MERLLKLIRVLDLALVLTVGFIAGVVIVDHIADNLLQSSTSSALLYLLLVISGGMLTASILGIILVLLTSHRNKLNEEDNGKV